MATALDSIKRAMRLLGVYAIGEDPSAEEAQDGLTALNAMLDEFANDRMVIYAPTLDAIPWNASVASMTIGPTGSFVTGRPVSVLASSYYEYLGVSYVLTPLTVDEYNAINLKSLVSDIPKYFWWNPQHPDGTLTLYPTPSAAISLKLWSTKQVISIPSLTTVIDLPPGYKNFIDYNLAESLAPEFQVPVPAAVAKKAALSRKAIARTNYIPRKLNFPSVALPRGAQFNIYTGQSE